MAEQHPTNDMFDVLASIRRLVSEERTVPQRIEPVPPAAPASAAAVTATVTTVTAAADLAEAPVAEAEPGARLTFARSESRFVLTPALRVADEGTEVRPADAAAADEPPAPPAPEAFIAPRAHQPAPDFTHAAPSRLTQDLDALDQRAASLEETIAELEAAVADISSEFEPDGGEPVDIVAEYFPDEAEPAAPLLAEFAADAPQAPPSFAAVRDLPLSAGPRVFGREPSAAETAALAESQPGVVRPHGIMAGFDAMGSAADDALDLPVTGEALIPAVLPPRPARDDMAERPGHSASPFGRSAAANTEPEAEDEPEAVDEAEPEVAAAEDATPAAPRSRLQILRPEGPVEESPVLESPGFEVSAPDATAGEDEGDGADEGTAAEVPDHLSALAAEPLAAAAGGDDEPGPPLFDPLADADYDVDALRDIVAELVRDELRGALGERITRNIRALVRAEMKRILAEDA